MNGLTGLQPQRVFQFFESICRIPHGSGNVSALVDYCVQFAEEQGLSWTRDSSNNLVIRKSGSIGYENSDVLILQGHTDMVCEKDTGVEFDFEKDSIVPFVDGDWMTIRWSIRLWRFCLPQMRRLGCLAHLHLTAAIYRDINSSI